VRPGSAAVTAARTGPRRYPWADTTTALRWQPSLGLARRDRVVADVAPQLHAVKLYLPGHLVGALLRGAHVVAQRGHAQHPAAAGDEVVAADRGAGVEHMAVLAGRRQAVDGIALARVVGVAGGGQHHAQRHPRVPLRLDLVERAVERMVDEVDEV